MQCHQVSAARRGAVVDAARPVHRPAGPARPLHAVPPLAQPRKHRRSAPVAPASQGGSAAATADATTAAPLSAADTWMQFAASVSGEWEGATASFGPDGEAQQLPEYYAFRDWGVELFDWQSQSSMLADAAGLTTTHRRMMPTVGCEADAIAFTQDACQLFLTSAAAPGFVPLTVAPDGGYSHGPADVSAADCFKASYEQCLVLQPLQRRLRVVHQLRRSGITGCWVLDCVELHSERYDTPFRGKVELSGCGGGLKGFATDERLAPAALQGSWTASGVRYRGGSDGACVAEAVAGEAWSADALQPTLLLHPLRSWSACSIGGEGGGDISLAAGVLLDESGSSMAVATRRIVGGRLAEAELLTLTRAG